METLSVYCKSYSLHGKMVLDRREIDTHEVLREEVLAAFTKNQEHEAGDGAWRKDRMDKG